MAKVKADLTGLQFGDLLVLGYDGNGRWLCECQCEAKTRKSVLTSHLTGGYVKSCGHNSVSNKFKDLTGLTFGKIDVISYAGNSYWNCRCQCENKTEWKVRGYELRTGKITQCKKCADESRQDDMTGQEIYNWKIKEYIGNKKYLCECTLCNREFEVLRSNIIRGKSKSCYECAVKNTHKDISGQKFGELTAEYYLGGSIWRCRCSCGEIEDLYVSKLISGKKTCCVKCYTHSSLKDLTGKTFGSWQVKRYVGDLYWECTCNKCGTTKNVLGYNLRSGHSLSCGCDKQINIKDKQFGDWTVIEYVDKGKWLCKCSCGNYGLVHSYELRNSLSKSCGCNRVVNIFDTLIDRYGEISVNKLDNKRSIEQINAVSCRDQMINFITNNFEDIPTTSQLANALGITESTVLKKIHKFMLEDKVNIGAYLSRYEDELYDILNEIKDAYNLNITILRKDKRTLGNGQELDIYIPELKLAVEINGTYWHSSIYKSEDYHQKKSLECISKGINLIHIFEYDWLHLKTKNIIVNRLKNKLISNNKVNRYDLKIVNKSDIRIDDFLYNTFGIDFISSYSYICCEHSGILVAVLIYKDNTIIDILSTIDNKCVYDKLYKEYIDKTGYDTVNYRDMLVNGINTSIIELGFKIDKINKPNKIEVDFKNNIVDVNLTNKNILTIYDAGSIDYCINTQPKEQSIKTEEVQYDIEI